MTYSYETISDAGQRWINDLMEDPEAMERGAPTDLDPSSMTETERDILVAYLSQDDGSLSAADLKFSARVAKEIENLAPRTEEAVSAVRI